MVKGKPAKFLALDGESVDDRYVMLCCSDGSYVENADGLSTLDCLSFLLALKRKYPDWTMVGFAFNYDVNMILKPDCSRVTVENLWKDREVSLVLGDEVFELTWIPTKFFRVRADVTADVSDVFGFFQMSFVKALQDWKVPEITTGMMERIEAGKQERANFTLDMMPEMREYCISECMMLADLCERLQDSLRDAGLKVVNWIGAGAVGQAMIKKYDVLKHHVPDYNLPEKLQEAVMYAYFGGRFEMFRQGYFAQCSNYDIISAYPYECTQLPSLHGRWEARTKYDPDEPYAVWLCRWDLPDGKVMPFPYRYKGNIYYPTEGMGWYWSNEVLAAVTMFPSIQVLEGWVFTPESTEQPFSFLQEVWAKRKEAKQQGLASQKAYKLGMNSLYGKLAQGRGYNGTIPKQRSFVWAGMITSSTRARLLALMHGQEDNVIAVATDGIFFETDPHYDVGDELGELELNQVDDFYQLLNGIYYSPNAKIRTRGHSPKELDWQHITAIWDESKFEGVYTYPARRFIGLGQALLRKDFSLWGTWVDSDRQIALHQHLRKWISNEAFEQFEVATFDNDNYTWYPGQLEGIKLGEVYKPKTDVLSVQSKADRKAVLDYIEMFEQPTLFMEG
jgi:hypothetical protein